MKEIFDVLPDKINSCLKDKSNLNKLQEIRVKVGKPLNIVLDNTETIFSYVIRREDVKAIIQKISNYSLYAFEEDIRQGYITIQGGHRVGLAGQCVIEDNSIKTIRNITSLNIRVCREIVGCSNSLMNSLVENNRVNNTLIISPPKCGKTTLLRDITRNISNGISQIGLKGKRTVVIDERSEIAACYNGIPQMNVGMRTDVYDNCIKSEGMMMAVRGLSPEVIICDEIGTYKDMEGLMMAYNSGVSIIATLHGRNVEELYRRPVFREIVENNIINKVVVLSGKKGIGTIEGIYNV
ncbi:stage III sporulation protein AA [Clostridium perfringens]|uniref:stage III sporulation protein AA n=1 Tax=Clostridium perfringens TaxID=1502 RepID=UPI002246AF40|nr:stage III sporulation protein AA [Clostridium perfringens]MCX0350297.1 stage III sporulation protein AA [Clostridium perfringens]MDU4760067.1 stage III sporulation protein AA [Clostridium perfringens]